MKRLITLLLIFTCLCALGSPKREMRGAWVATIYGLDWPAASGTDRATMLAQQQQLQQVLDRLHHAGCNAVMFQARTFGDAMYRSQLEPWAKALTGQRGTAPFNNWDPLEYCVAEAHKRGMECHAWINPFRYSVQSAPYTDAYNARFKPWLLTYTEQPRRRKDKAKTYTILDPGNPQARAHVVDVCRDIVSRYDVDGIIFDDYFYPDRLPLGSGYDYNEWRQSGTQLSQADWRRSNVNSTLEAVYKAIKEVKPWASFGVSPAGVGGGNGVSASRYGLPACTGNDWMYDRIFCDPLAWMDGGYVDYISPQLYWARNHATNPYDSLAAWWSQAAVKMGCGFYASHSLSSMAQAGGNTPEAHAERGAQIATNRLLANQLGFTPGSIMYAARNMNEFGDYLALNNFKDRALPPVTKTSTPMPDPGCVKNLSVKGAQLQWEAPAANLRYAVYAIPHEMSPLDAMSIEDGTIDSRYLLDLSYTTSYTIPADIAGTHYCAVSVIDRAGNEWEAQFTR